MKVYGCIRKGTFSLPRGSSLRVQQRGQQPYQCSQVRFSPPTGSRSRSPGEGSLSALLSKSPVITEGVCGPKSLYLLCSKNIRK